MKNAERVARDIGLKIGQYERGEITAKDLVYQVHHLAIGNCEQCVYNKPCHEARSESDRTRYMCFDGFDLWLDSEV